ncbi:hypothetical protein ONS95_008444 [Cadophora gregata]|uniref:uncharacterized protein n=1 Tax=Cadophora gregata TaxID=51156 RepID=UPI0026DB0A18|nr:uncharacterized protein ONS95_008444 [Cadophora gregata]KAK0100495.1 hypothetical protein ONS96_007770 [Cadophora gregata f. sp. sojae]KAK0126865.1 hypothetical protein ONS95_008444 [Cadophora gregata]
MSMHAKTIESLREENMELYEQVGEAMKTIHLLPTRKAYHERKEENEKFKKEIRILKSQKQTLEQPAIPNKKKLQERIQVLQSELKEAKQFNKSTISQVEDMKAQAATMKKQLTGSERCRETEVWDLREEVKELETRKAKLQIDLGSMELLAGRLENENTVLKGRNTNTTTLLDAEISRVEDFTEQLVDAQEFVSLARYPLESCAKIRRRLFNGRRGDFWINEEGNRNAHDGYLISDVFMCKLDQMSPTDITMMARVYGHDFRDSIKSSEDLHRLHRRGFQLELINLRASTDLEDPQTCS